MGLLRRVFNATPAGMAYNAVTKGPVEAAKGTATGQLISAGVDAAGKVGDWMGLSAPDTAALQGDTQALRDMRAQFAAEYGQTGPRETPQVQAAQSAGVNLGPAAQIGGVTLRQTPGVSAPTIGPNERATAAQATASDVQRTDPTRAAFAMSANPARAAEFQAAQIATGPQDQARAVQNEAIQATRDVLSGKAPSLAELQMREQLGRNQAGILSQAAGARGLRAASQRRAAMREYAKAGSDANFQGAMLRANEVAQARGQLGGLATDTRGQDIGLATNQAGLEQGARQFNAGELGATSRFNSGQQQALNITNAGFQQQATQNDADRTQQSNITDANLRTGVSQSNAGLQTGVNTFNAGQTNQRNTDQARMDFAAEDANANRTQQTNLAQGQLSQGAQIFNAGSVNDRTNTQGQLTQQNNQFNTGQANTVNTQNADRTLQGRQLDDQQRSGLRGDMIDAAQGATQGSAAALGAEEAGKNRRTGLVGNIGQAAAGALAAMSDKDLKTGVKMDPKAVEEFLRDTKPVTFSFKSSASGPAVGPGKQLGVLAQDVEESGIGSKLVVNGPGGKALDQGNFAGPLLAAMSHLNDKLNAVMAKKRQAAKELR